ncbi:MAG: hypothetical protein WC840_01110 [Candidatus Peribacteraceae bacterium]
MLRFFEVKIDRPGKKKPLKTSLQIPGVDNRGVRDILTSEVVAVAQAAGLRQQETFDGIRTLVGSCRAINGKPLRIEIDPNNIISIFAKSVSGIDDLPGYDLDDDQSQRGFGLG